MDKDERHEDTMRRIVESHEPVLRVAAELHRAYGFVIEEIKPPSLAPSFEERGEHSDGGDIWTRMGGERELLEVKHSLSREFHSVESLGFPMVAVDSVNNYDKKPQRPKYYYFVNKSMTGCIIIPGVTWPKWDKHPFRDYREYDSELYRCPKEYCSWWQFLDEELWDGD